MGRQQAGVGLTEVNSRRAAVPAGVPADGGVAAGAGDGVDEAPEHEAQGRQEDGGQQRRDDDPTQVLVKVLLGVGLRRHHRHPGSCGRC